MDFKTSNEEVGGIQSMEQFDGESTVIIGTVMTLSSTTVNVRACG